MSLVVVTMPRVVTTTPVVPIPLVVTLPLAPQRSRPSRSAGSKGISCMAAAFCCAATAEEGPHRSPTNGPNWQMDTEEDGCPKEPSKVGSGGSPG